MANLPNLGRYIYMVLVYITHIHFVEHFACILQPSGSCRGARDNVLLMYLSCLIWTHFQVFTIHTALILLNTCNNSIEQSSMMLFMKYLGLRSNIQRAITKKKSKNAEINQFAPKILLFPGIQTILSPNNHPALFCSLIASR